MVKRVAVLASVAGFVDAVGFLTLFGLFIAHMSGNTTQLGVALGTWDSAEFWKRAFVIPEFILATAFGVWMIARLAETKQSRPMLPMVALEIALLSGFMIFGGILVDSTFRADSLGFYAVASFALVAMGIQNAMVRHAGKHSVHTTYITGMLTEVAVGLVRWSNAQSTGDKIAHKERVVLGSATWGAYIAGAAAGALLFDHFNWKVLMIPIIALAVYGSVVKRPETAI